MLQADSDDKMKLHHIWCNEVGPIKALSHGVQKKRRSPQVAASPRATACGVLVSFSDRTSVLALGLPDRVDVFVACGFR